MEARRRFGIMACPEGTRVIWWLLPSGEGQPIFSNRSLEDCADGLDTVELVMALEEEFGMEIPDEDAKKLRSVEDVIEYIEEHRKKK